MLSRAEKAIQRVRRNTVRFIRVTLNPGLTFCHPCPSEEPSTRQNPNGRSVNRMAEQALKPWFQQSSRFGKRDLGPSPSPRNGQLGIGEDPGLHVRGPGTAAMALLNISSKALVLWGGKPNSRGQENHRNASSRQSLCTA